MNPTVLVILSVSWSKSPAGAMAKIFWAEKSRTWGRGRGGAPCGRPWAAQGLSQLKGLPAGADKISRRRLTYGRAHFCPGDDGGDLGGGGGDVSFKPGRPRPGVRLPSHALTSTLLTGRRQRALCLKAGRLQDCYGEKGLGTCPNPFFFSGGDDETRTRDLRRDRPAF
jgi:hypothetical protein